jgi:hypothetical protein
LTIDEAIRRFREVGETDWRATEPVPRTELPFESADTAYKKIGSSLKCMGNPVRNMIEIRHHVKKEIDTDHHERQGFISVGIGFDTAMACGIVCV